MLTKLLGIIEMIFKLVWHKKTDTKFIDAERKEKEKTVFNGFKDDIQRAHETDDIETLRKHLGD